MSLTGILRFKFALICVIVSFCLQDEENGNGKGELPLFFAFSVFY